LLGGTMGRARGAAAALAASSTASSAAARIAMIARVTPECEGRGR
jgi:hypothetical protein